MILHKAERLRFIEMIIKKSYTDFKITRASEVTRDQRKIISLLRDKFFRKQEYSHISLNLSKLIERLKLGKLSFTQILHLGR